MTLLEMLLVVACLSCVVAVGLMVGNNSQNSAKEIKLRHDVAVINSSLRTYLASGGAIETNTPEGAILALKRQAALADSMKIAGLRGTMIDRRLEGVSMDSQEPGLRAVWDSGARQFTLAESGAGYREFVLNPNAALITPEDNRKSSFDLATQSKWVWDHNAASSGPKTARANAPTGSGPIAMPHLAAVAVGELLPPKFSLPPGYYSYSSLKDTLKLQLVDQNPSDTAQIYYSIDDGAWTQYAGEEIDLSKSFATSIRAYTVSLSPDAWSDSGIVTQDYETVWFSGSNTGVFYSPRGDRNLQTNLTYGKRGSYFEWGDPASGYTKPNSLKFEGASFAKVAPEEKFVLGTLTYYNGTTYANTNATSVKIDMNLNLTEPAATEKLSFTFSLYSTTNRTNQTDDENADFVHIPTISSSFSTTIQGRTYYLKLHFGTHDANGFTTIDTFHTHENKTMSGTVCGTLTTTP